MVVGFKYLADAENIIKEGTKEERVALVDNCLAERGTEISALKGTMRIFSSAFSDSVLTGTTRELQLATLKMTTGLDKITDGLKRGTEAGANEAMEGWTEAIYYGDVYTGLANANMPRNLEPIVGPKGKATKLVKEAENSVNGAF